MKLLNFIPVSSDPCGLYLYGQPANNPDDQWIGRVDWVASEKQNSHTATEVVSATNRMLMREARSRRITTAPRRKTSVPVASGSATRARKA